MVADPLSGDLFKSSASSLCRGSENVSTEVDHGPPAVVVVEDVAGGPCWMRGGIVDHGRG